MTPDVEPTLLSSFLQSARDELTATRRVLSQVRAELTATQCALDLVTAQRDRIAADWEACLPVEWRPMIREYVASSARVGESSTSAPGGGWPGLPPP